MSSSKLYFGNLDYSVTSQDLNDFLAANWQVVDCKVIEGKGFGFVTFANPEVAGSAKEALNSTMFNGRTLKIDFARENQNRSGGGGSRNNFNGPRRRY
jgi:RNA recognition motif-containing protein